MHGTMLWPAQLQAEDGEAGTELKSLLKGTAEVYRTLLGNAQKAGIAVPPEALLGGAGAAGKGAPRWNDLAALEAEDWEDFEDEGNRSHVGCIECCCMMTGSAEKMLGLLQSAWRKDEHAGQCFQSREMAAAAWMGI